jgi:hypothetical protein
MFRHAIFVAVDLIDDEFGCGLPDFKVVLPDPREIGPG